MCLDCLAVSRLAGTYVNALPSAVYGNMIRQMSKRGGDSLCIDPDEAPFWLFSVATDWDDPADDEFMSGLLQEPVKSVDRVTREHGVFHRYKYFHYADAWQAEDVWTRCSDGDLKRTRRLQRDSDPDQVFVAEDRMVWVQAQLEGKGINQREG